jgi:hypothetical protein
MMTDPDGRAVRRRADGLLVRHAHADNRPAQNLLNAGPR